LVVTDCTNPNTARQIRVVQQTMAAANYGVMIFDTQEDGAQQQDAIHRLEENVVDGIILTPAAAHGASLADLARRVPLVLLNREILEPVSADIVLNDNAGGAYLATSHLLQKGHQRIAYVTARREISTVRERLRGYSSALLAAGIEPDDRLIARAEITVEDAAAATADLLRLDPRPTAILAYNDFMAVGVLSALRSAGLTVPQDVAIVGYDDIVYAPYLQVPLTTVAQQTLEMGRAAATILLNRLGGDESPPQRIVLAPSLVVRESSGT
jgi:LacI family transcriptional regulator